MEKYIAIKNGKLNLHNRKWLMSSEENVEQSDIEDFIYQHIDTM